MRLRTSDRERAMVEKKEIEKKKKKSSGVQPGYLIIILWHSSQPSVPYIHAQCL